jgi:hypothetical protein
MAWERFSLKGEKFVPHKYEDGFYRMADPKLGGAKHHSRNQIVVRSDEIENYLHRGFSLRMRGCDSGKVNLISPSKIRRS